MKFPLAIMDYGIGGMGLVSMIKERYPDIPILYFSDSGEVPYGKLTSDVLKTRVYNVIDYLYGHEAQHVVVACHSASSVVQSNGRLTGIREATVHSLHSYSGKEVGVIGGGRTIKAGYYRDTMKEMGIIVKQRVAQQLSILIEGGEVDTLNVIEAVNKIVKPIKDVDALLLACTHYPAIQGVLKKAIKSSCELIDPVEEIFKSVAHLLKSKNHTEKEDMYLTSGDPFLMKEATQRAFGLEIKAVKKVKV